ncbi:MAG: hypothetical protein KDD77_10005 [Caldilineaceae bacterium]|nr:hypothetical protein [Caldilineaceae bacterium]MCB0067474.1 hypothetical protein [Caldilineaceae bacterium]
MLMVDETRQLNEENGQRSMANCQLPAADVARRAVDENGQRSMANCQCSPLGWVRRSSAISNLQFIHQQFAFSRLPLNGDRRTTYELLLGGLADC